VANIYGLDTSIYPGNSTMAWYQSNCQRTTKLQSVVRVAILLRVNMVNGRARAVGCWYAQGGSGNMETHS
jgi:hypothetical protein